MKLKTTSVHAKIHVQTRSHQRMTLENISNTGKRVITRKYFFEISVWFTIIFENLAIRKILHRRYITVMHRIISTTIAFYWEDIIYLIHLHSNIRKYTSHLILLNIPQPIDRNGLACIGTPLIVCHNYMADMNTSLRI